MKWLSVILSVALSLVMEVLFSYVITYEHSLDSDSTMQTVCAVDAPAMDCVVNMTEEPNVPAVRISDTFSGNSSSIRLSRYFLGSHATTIECAKIRNIECRVVFGNNAFNRQIDYNIYRLRRLLIQPILFSIILFYRLLRCLMILGVVIVTYVIIGKSISKM